jgi:hypothetical protein
MAPQPWTSNVFKQLDMIAIRDFPHGLPNDVDTWLPRFSDNNDVLAKENLNFFCDSLGLHDVHYEHQDVVMRLFSTSLVKDANLWYNNLPIKSIKTWKTLENVFLKKWEIEKSGALLWSQFCHITKEEQEPISEFNARFDALIEDFPDNSRPKEEAI